MSGFLQRLAAQAMGVANPLRTAAGSPFAGPPARGEDHFNRVPVVTDIAPVVRVSGRHAGRDDAVPATSGASDVSIGPFAKRQDLHAGSAFGLKAEQLPGGRQNVTGVAGTEMAERSISNPPTSEPSPDQSAGRGEMNTFSLRVPERAAPVDAEQAASDVPTPSGSAPIESGPPELLLPSPARPAAARDLLARERQWPTRPQRSPTRAGAGTTEETTEVHVNIGRIEVTALHEASPPKRPAPRRPAPMSLDDYVARRQGGRS